MTPNERLEILRYRKWLYDHWGQVIICKICRREFRRRFRRIEYYCPSCLDAEDGSSTEPIFAISVRTAGE